VNNLPTPSARLRAAHLVALSAFGIAQPMFSLLTKQPFQLAVQGFHAIDVVIYGIALVLIPPAFLMAIELLVGLASQRLASFVHRFFVGALGCLVLLRVADGLPSNYAYLGALFGALMFVRLYSTQESVRLFMTFCSIAAIGFLAIFVVRAPLTRLSTTDVQAATAKNVAARTPVVLVIFDEFDVSAIMTRRGTIDAARYPNFGALARSSTWHRNATTVHDYTFWAVPAILTGIRPRHDQMPVVADHPRNLFTLLGGSYRINAFEAVTRLCPASLCPAAEQPLGVRMHRLATYFDGFFKKGDFLSGKFNAIMPDWEDPPAQVSRFLDPLDPNDPQSLYVLHVLLPHHPWRYLPSGRSYSGSGSLRGLTGDKWAGGSSLANRAYERHLLQVGYVDLVLGRIIQRLRETGLWKPSLMIVTADHGISFRPGEPVRNVDTTNIADIAPVPLFVKEPEQNTGVVDDRSARTIDIVPTIADVLGIHAPWRLDGRSLFSRNRPYPTEIVVASITGDVVRAPWEAIEAGRARTIARRTKLFGSITYPGARRTEPAP
jgi:hypothetical protein